VVIDTPSRIGARAELAVASALWKAGMEGFTPFFGAQKGYLVGPP
jgi:hypothetical protein